MYFSKVTLAIEPFFARIVRMYSVNQSQTVVLINFDHDIIDEH